MGERYGYDPQEVRTILEDMRPHNRKVVTQSEYFPVLGSNDRFWIPDQVLEDVPNLYLVRVFDKNKNNGRTIDVPFQFKEVSKDPRTSEPRLVLVATPEYSEDDSHAVYYSNSNGGLKVWLRYKANGMHEFMQVYPPREMLM